MITGIHKLETLTKHISCKFKQKFDGRKCNSNQKWNNDKCQCECKNLKQHYVCKKDYIWNLATCCWKNRKYLAIIIDDKILDTTKRVLANFNEKK